MTLAARRQAIYADLLALPSHVVGEIIDGEVVVSPRPAMPHAGGATTLGATSCAYSSWSGPSHADGETRNSSGTASVAVPRRHSSKRSALSGASGPTYTVRAPALRATAAKPAAG